MLPPVSSAIKRRRSSTPSQPSSESDMSAKKQKMTTMAAAVEKEERGDGVGVLRLADLPAELIALVATWLDDDSRDVLRRTCRSIHAITNVSALMPSAVSLQTIANDVRPRLLLSAVAAQSSPVRLAAVRTVVAQHRVCCPHNTLSKTKTEDEEGYDSDDDNGDDDGETMGLFELHDYRDVECYLGLQALVLQATGTTALRLPVCMYLSLLRTRAGPLDRLTERWPNLSEIALRGSKCLLMFEGTEAHEFALIRIMRHISTCCKGLRTLELDFQPVTDRSMSHLGHLPHLESLTLCSCNELTVAVGLMVVLETNGERLRTLCLQGCTWVDEAAAQLIVRHCGATLEDLDVVACPGLVGLQVRTLVLGCQALRKVQITDTPDYALCLRLCDGNSDLIAKHIAAPPNRIFIRSAAALLPPQHQQQQQSATARASCMIWVWKHCAE